jgi:hypothetical protein
MTTTTNDTSYDAVSSYDLRNNIIMNKNTQEYCYESNSPFSKIEKDRKKQIPNMKFVSNNNREVRWVS